MLDGTKLQGEGVSERIVGDVRACVGEDALDFGMEGGDGLERGGDGRETVSEGGGGELAGSGGEGPACVHHPELAARVCAVTGGASVGDRDCCRGRKGR